MARSLSRNNLTNYMPSMLSVTESSTAYAASLAVNQPPAHWSPSQVLQSNPNHLLPRPWFQHWPIMAMRLILNLVKSFPCHVFQNHGSLLVGICLHQQFIIGKCLTMHPLQQSATLEIQSEAHDLPRALEAHHIISIPEEPNRRVTPLACPENDDVSWIS